MGGVASDFVGDYSDSCIAITEAHAFGRYTKSGEYDGIVLRIGFFSIAIGITVVVGSEVYDDKDVFLKR